MSLCDLSPSSCLCAVCYLKHSVESQGVGNFSLFENLLYMFVCFAFMFVCAPHVPKGRYQIPLELEL